MNSAASKFSPWVTVLAFICGCVPEIDDDPSLVVEGQILAVQFEPAEVKPESATQVNALVAASDDAELEKDVSFALCVARKPLSELGPVHPACLHGEDEDARRAVGRGIDVQLTVPKNACNLFGPQRPPAEPGQPPGRPVDPDATGGFYQPVVATLDAAVLGSLRLNCGLPGGSQAQVAQYNQDHVANQNPVAQKLEIKVADGEWQTIPFGADDAVRVPRDEAISVRSRWDKRERYLLLSTETRELTHANETLVASFYSTVGGFDEHRVQLDKNSRASSRFHTPRQRGEVRMWIVVRDGRSGTGWTSFKLDVR